MIILISITTIFYYAMIGLAIGAVAVFCHWYYHKVFKVVEREHTAPKAGNCNYYKDYCNLYETISRAQSLKQLKQAKGQVRDLRKKYLGKVPGVSVKGDSVKLNEHIESMEVALGMGPTVLN